MAGIKCKCGRFLAKPRATSDQAGEGYSWHEFLADVRGDCSRCGPDVQASREGEAWWWDADAWNRPDSLADAL